MTYFNEISKGKNKVIEEWFPLYLQMINIIIIAVNIQHGYRKP